MRTVRVFFFTQFLFLKKKIYIYILALLEMLLLRHTLMVSLVLPTGQRIGLLNPCECDLKWGSVGFVPPHTSFCLQLNYFTQLFMWLLGEKIPISSCPRLPMTVISPSTSLARVLFSDICVHPFGSIARNSRVDRIWPDWGESQWKEVFLSSASKRGSDVDVQSL